MKNTKSFREFLEGLSLFAFDTSTGLVIPQTNELLEAWTVVIANVFGIPESNLSTRFTSSTPLGRLVEALAVRDQRACAITASYANQINPNYATGQALDAIGSFFRVLRIGAMPTKIAIDVAGTPGTVIPAGRRIKNNAGLTFTTDIGITIGEDGSASGSASCEQNGHVDFEIGSIQTIVDRVSGWTIVKDVGIITPGFDIETDNNFRNRILNSRWSGTGFVQSILSAILRVNKVRSAIVLDNGESGVRYYTENGTIEEDEPEEDVKYVAIYGHSILVVADATDENIDDVARACFDNKSAGCGYTPIDGQSSTISVTDGSFAYNVIVNTPKSVAFDVAVTVRRNQHMGSVEDIVNEVKSAVTDWANGNVPNVDGISIGQSIYPFEIGAAVSDIIKSIQVKNVAISGEGVRDGYLPLFVKEIGVLGNITVTVE